MTNIFNPGVGGTLASGNKVAALLEILYLLQARERATPNVDVLQIVLDSNARTATFTNEIPIVTSIGSDGTVRHSAAEYLTDNTFSNGGGELKSATLADGVLELSQAVATEQLDFNAANPTETPLTNIGITYDPIGGTATVTGVIPYTESLVGGKPTLTAVDFLA